MSQLDLPALTEFSLIAGADPDAQRIAPDVIRVVTDLDDENDVARLVRANLVWELMEVWDIDLEIASMGSLFEAEVQLGAAGIVLDRLARRAAWSTDETQASPAPPDVITALEHSVSAEPSWVNNHVQLAVALHEAGETRLARRERDQALANVRGTAGASGMTPRERAWAISFTGVSSNPDVMRQRYEEIQ